MTSSTYGYNSISKYSSMNISDFIHNFYDVIYQGTQVTTKDFSDVDEFLLSDIHNSEGHNVINSLFINTFSNKNDVVLVESVSSMKKIDKDKNYHSACLTTTSNILGWDAEYLPELAKDPLWEKTADLEIKARVLLRDYCNPAFSNDKEQLKTKLLNTFHEIQYVSQKITPIALSKLCETLSSCFPARTHSMIKTLIKVRSMAPRSFLIIDKLHLMEKPLSRTFLIAGQDHLQNTRQDSNYSLKELMEFSKSRKLVVLFPKSEKLHEMAKEKMEPFSDLYVESMGLKGTEIGKTLKQKLQQGLS
jgi:hypothetical protein